MKVELEELKEDVFIFLDTLRESGATNMFGAGPYVQEEFELNKYDARELVKAWMKKPIKD